MTAQARGSPLSCRNASQSPSRLRAHYYKCIIFLPPLSFSWRGESVIKVPLSFCGVWGSCWCCWWVQGVWGRFSCILTWIFLLPLPRLRKAHQLQEKGQKGGRKERGDSPTLSFNIFYSDSQHSEFQHSPF